MRCTQQSKTYVSSKNIYIDKNRAMHYHELSSRERETLTINCSMSRSRPTLGRSGIICVTTLNPASFDILNDSVTAFTVWPLMRRTEHSKRKLDFYSAPLWEASLWSTQHGSQFFTLQLHHTCLYLVKHSPDGATIDSDNSRLIAAYYSFINPERWKAELD